MRARNQIGSSRPGGPVTTGRPRVSRLRSPRRASTATESEAFKADRLMGNARWSIGDQKEDKQDFGEQACEFRNKTTEA